MGEKMTKFTHRIMLVCGTALAFPMAASAQSQGETTSESTPAASAENDSSVIVVTAQRRTERLIDAPQSVSVVSAADLERLNATQFRDFATTIPSLTFNSAGAGFTQVSLRGVTTGVDTSATVGVYVDDVPYGSSSAFARGGTLALDSGLFDLSRIEVLRGPQGTLYGASSMGGLIKYVSSTPDLRRFETAARGGVSFTRHGDVNYNAALRLNAPIVNDRVALRASGFYEHDGGYIDNLGTGRENVNRADIYGGRADLLIKPSEALSIRVQGFLQNIDRDGTPIAIFNTNGVPVDDSLTQRTTFDEPFRQRFRIISGTILYDFGPVDLTSVSSYQRVETNVVREAPGTALALRPLGISAVAIPVDTSTNKFTQEVRLASTGQGQFEWLVGGFYTKEDSDDRSFLVLRDLAGAPRANNLLTFAGLSTYEEYAGFGDVTWRPSSKFDVTVGLRYAHNRQVYEQLGTGLLGRSSPPTSRSESVFTYLANARYHFDSRTILYVRYATGYRPGGPNFSLLDPVTGQPFATPAFEADRLSSYEVGFRYETPSRSFGIDASAFYIDWDNVQIQISRSGFGARANAAGGATVRGAELTLTARPSSELTFTGAFSYLDAELAAAEPQLGAAKGERLPGTPNYTGTINADYVMSSSELAPSFGATLRFMDDRTVSYSASPNRPRYRLPSFVTVDLRAGIRLEPVNLQLYVHNLFDTRPQFNSPTDANYPLTGPLGISILQPRTIGISASTQF